MQASTQRLFFKKSFKKLLREKNIVKKRKKGKTLNTWFGLINSLLFRSKVQIAHFLRFSDAAYIEKL